MALVYILFYIPHMCVRFDCFNVCVDLMPFYVFCFIYIHALNDFPIRCTCIPRIKANSASGLVGG